MAEYKIGTDHADLDWIYNKFPADGFNQMPDPRSDPQEYFTQIMLGNGGTRSFGWLRQDWHWDIMTETQCAILRTYIGNVNVLTRNNGGIFWEYTGELIWPEREPEHFNNHVLDVTVTIIKLITV